MRDFKVIIAFVAMLVPTLPGLGAPTTPATAMAEPSTASVDTHADPERISRHLRALTGMDSSTGSAPTVRATAAGGDRAAEYIATQLMSYGLRPAGADGTYFQSVALTEVKTLPDTSLTVVASDLTTLPLRNLEDVVTQNETPSPAVYVDAPIVFVGYGIEAPEYGRRDYKEVNVDGKAALMLAGDPPGSAAGLAGHAPTHYGSPGYKFAEAARRGAVAVLLVPNTSSASDDRKAARAEWGTARFYWQGDDTPRLRAASWVSAEAARRLAALAGLDFDGLVAEARAGDFSPVDLPLRLQAHVASEVRAVEARNVVAVLPGRGARSQQAVVYTARYDRLQSDAAPGADHPEHDRTRDATGVATLLEAARLWSQPSAVTPRSILFVTLAAENHGLPAADDFIASEGAVPPGQISLSLNFEPQAPEGETHGLVVQGAARTSFATVVAATIKALGLAVHSDPFPASGRDYESGAYQLALAGIPSLSLTRRRPAAESGRPGEPAPTTAPQFAGDAELARLGYELGVRAGSQSELVAWLPGDEFEAVRKRSQIAPHNKPPERKPKRVR